MSSKPDMQLMTGTAQMLEHGKTLHRQGQLEEAAGIYRQVLATERDNPDALHLLGVIANQRGDYPQAVSLIGQAIRQKPDAEHFHCNLGLALMGMGDLEGAQSQFVAELEKYPNSHASHVNLGVLLQKQSRQEQAIEHYRAALSLQPGDVMALNNLGFAYMELFQFEAAEEMARTSLSKEARNPEALNLLGLLSRQQGRFEEAVEHFMAAARINPAAAEIQVNMGVAYKELGNDEEAIACYERALEKGEASVRVFNNIGLAHCRLGNLDEASRWYDRALEADSADAGTHFNRSLMLLLQGQFEDGWKEYEFGLACGERQPRLQDVQRWQGESLAGKSLLVCAEQGLGDEIMFASILPELISEAGHCVVECDARLLPIYERSFPTATVIRRRLTGEDCSDEVLPHVDLQVPLGSLALYRRNRIEDFPIHAGYLKADPERVAHWKRWLDTLGPGLKVGISWRGGVQKTGGKRRSIPLEDLLPIFKQQGLVFVSLQYTDCTDELESLKRKHGISVHHWQEAIDNYDETAALVCALDIVICVQTAVVHLAGALGRLVWVMLPVPAAWRYGSEGENMPWYPSVRLYRQRQRGQWLPVIERIAQDLTELSDGNPDQKE